MADLYGIYRDVLEDGEEKPAARQYAPNTDVEEQRVRAEAQRYTANTRLLQEYQKELGRTDKNLIIARQNERKNQLKAINDSNANLVKSLDTLRKADAQTYAAAAAAVSRAYAATVKAQADMVQAQYAFEPADYVGFTANMQYDSGKAIEALTGSMRRFAETGSKYMQPALINKILAEVFKQDPRGLNLLSDPDELRAGLQEKGANDEVIKAFLDARDQALEVWNAVKAGKDAANRSLADVEGILAQGYTTSEDINARVNVVEQKLDAGLQRVTAALDASPEKIQQAIDYDNMALEERNTLEARVNELWRQREAYNAGTTPEGDLDGRILADDNFRLWANDNGFEDIGSPQFNEKGEVIGAAKGKDYNSALRMYYWQMRNSGKWAHPFKPQGGAYTGQVVEVSYVPDEAPRVAAIDGQAFLRLNGKTYRADETGAFVPSDEPAGADWQLAVKQPAGAEDFQAIQSVEGLSANDILIPEGTDERAKAENIYSRTVIGEREAQQAAFVQRYDVDGYVALRDDQGQRIEIDGALKPKVKIISGGTQAAGVGAAQRKALRRAASGKGPEIPLGADRAPGAPLYQFGGVTIEEGPLSEDPRAVALREKILAQQAEEAAPELSVVADVTAGRAERRKRALAEKRRPPIPAGSDLPDAPPVEEMEPPQAVAPATEEYKRSTLYPSTPDVTVETRAPEPPKPPAEDEPFVVPPEAQTPETDDNRRQKRKELLNRRFYSRPRP